MTGEEWRVPRAHPRHQRSCALIVVEHDMNFIKMIASRVTVFHQGSILIEDTMEHLLRNPQVRDIYLGRQAEAPNA